MDAFSFRVFVDIYLSSCKALQMPSSQVLMITPDCYGLFPRTSKFVNYGEPL